MTHRIEIKAPTRAHPHWTARLELVPIKGRPRRKLLGKRMPIDAEDIDEALVAFATEVRAALYPVMKGFAYEVETE